MSLKDKLEIGLKPDAPYRPDNLPETQQGDPDCARAAEPGDGEEQQQAREDCSDSTQKPRVGKPRRTDGVPDE